MIRLAVLPRHVPAFRSIVGCRPSLPPPSSLLRARLTYTATLCRSLSTRSWEEGLCPRLLACNTSKEFLRYAKKAGADVDPNKGKGSHVQVRGPNKSFLCSKSGDVRTFITIAQPGLNSQVDPSLRKSYIQGFVAAGIVLKER